MEGGIGRRKFDSEFKREAVRQVVEGGRSVAEVARSLGIHEMLLHKWKRQLNEDSEGAFPGKGRLKPQDEELRRLQRENTSLKEDREILKKAFGHLLKTPRMKYGFMERERSKFAVERMCRLFGVTRSGYYAWLRGRDTKRRLKENEALLEAIRRFYKASRGTYGSPRITEDLRDAGLRCGENRIARLMRVNGIMAKTRRRFKATTNSRHCLLVDENLLERRFTADGPNKVWTSDITYVWTEEGRLYLTVVLDVFSRQIVGWAMGDRIDTALVLRAFNQAVMRRRPAPGLIFHSDRGSQYASVAFRKALKRCKAIQSMSNKGDCHDNAVTETFFHTLKTELVYFERYKTRAEAKRGIFEYIEVFYNRLRRHSALGYRSPLAFEQSKVA
ncbi:MAG: IS3 family transposase [Deltaproteobacteria bacterium]|nr:IS3 family transposase [Deltaproteobacteria bacterium]